MSDTNNPFYTNEWIQYYQETQANPSAPVEGSGSFDHGASSMMTDFSTNNVSSSTMISGGSSGGGVINSGNNSPQPLSPLKPVRRRSRASKKTPVTLLNASATNFRALVQQFTGCPRTTGSGRAKGPVNLNFERNDYGLTENDRSTYTSYDQQGITQPQGSFGNSDPSRNSMQSGFIDESSLSGRSNNGGGYFF